eukprot:NODE_188_length_15619_cov_0.374871.p11 type:complete len:109 gc:universal NODE_188_length_15619_cov_0.374871:8287-7961(-)
MRADLRSWLMSISQKTDLIVDQGVRGDPNSSADHIEETIEEISVDLSEVETRIVTEDHSDAEMIATGHLIGMIAAGHLKATSDLTRGMTDKAINRQAFIAVKASQHSR